MAKHLKSKVMVMKPNVFRIKMAADRMLAWIKKNEPSIRYTHEKAIEQFLRKHAVFNSDEAEEAIKSLIKKGSVYFDNSLVTTGKSPRIV